MGLTFHVTMSFGMTHVILKTTTRTRTLKGGGFGLTGTVCSSKGNATMWFGQSRANDHSSYNASSNSTKFQRYHHLRIISTT